MKKLKRTANWGENAEILGPRDWYRLSMLLKEVIQRKPTGKLLDFGCGSGHLLFRLLRYGYECVAVDSSALVVKFLKEKVSKTNFSHKLSVILGNEKTLLRYKNTFDIVVSTEVVEHVKHDDKLVKNFYTVLKPNGICVVSVPAHMNYWDINDDFSRHYRRYEKNTLGDLFIQAGFIVEKQYVWGFPLTLLWHKIFFLKYINTKSLNSSSDTQLHGFLYKIFTNETWINLASYIFWFDSLWDWTELGGGIILIARKPKK